MTSEILEQCDPGIKPVIRWLWANKFETIDSGDGITKLQDGTYAPEDVVTVPHVALKLEQGLTMLVYLNAAESLDMLAMRIDGEYRIEVTRSYPDHITTIMFFPSNEWIANLRLAQMLNLLPHPVTVSGVTLEPAFGSALEWHPIVVNNPPSPFPALLGFTPRESMPELEAGADVLVPRFAPAVTWALKRGYTPHCLPLDPRGRQPDGSFVCTELEPAPDGLAVSFVGIDALLPLPASPRIHRATPGNFIVEVLYGSDLLPVPEDKQAIRRPDGSVQYPRVRCDDTIDAILVPLDGAIINHVHEIYPDHALLVCDVPRRGQRTRLFQVR